MKRKRIWIPLLVLMVVMTLMGSAVALAVTSVDGFNDTLQAILNNGITNQSETNNALLRAFEMILP